MAADELSRTTLPGTSDSAPERDRTDRLIAAALWDVPVPSSLRTRVLTQLSHESPGSEFPSKQRSTVSAEEMDARAVIVAASELKFPADRRRHGPRWSVLAAGMAMAIAVLLALLLGPASRPSAWRLDVLVAEAMVLDLADTTTSKNTVAEDAALEKLFDPSRYAAAPMVVRILGIRAQAYRLVDEGRSCVLVVLPRSALESGQEVRGLFHDSTLGPSGTVARVLPLDDTRFVIAVADSEATIDHFRVKRSSFLADCGSWDKTLRFG